MAIKTMNNRVPVTYTVYYKKYFTPPEGDPIMETFMTTPIVKLANKNSIAS